MKTILSLFDSSGQWAEFYSRAGCDVITWDIKQGRDALVFDSAESALDILEDVDGILAAPPCTHFSVSGAQYWGAKDQDGRTAEALELLNITRCLGDLFTPTDEDYDGGFFWCFENPVGRIPKLVPGVGKPYYFDPCDFAGWLDLSDGDHNELERLRRKDGQGFTSDEVQFVLDCNAYTKKTGLWGCFNRELEKNRVDPVRVCAQGSPLMRMGGKSEKTKEARSNTPRGFSRAFYAANDLSRSYWDDDELLH